MITFSLAASGCAAVNSIMIAATIPAARGSNSIRAVRPTDDDMASAKTVLPSLMQDDVFGRVTLAVIEEDDTPLIGVVKFVKSTDKDCRL